MTLSPFAVGASTQGRFLVASALPLLLFFLLLLILLPSPALSAAFGTFLSQYSLPTAFTAVGLGVGQSGTLYALSSTHLISYASPSSAPVTSTINFTSATWLAAQPGSDLLLVADAGAGDFVFVNSASPLSRLAGFTSPRACGFVINSRVVLLDRTSPSTLLVSSVTIGQVAGTSFYATWPAALGGQVGFATDYAEAYVVLSLSEGLVGYDLMGNTVFTYQATADNSIAFIRAAIAGDTLGHLFLAQSTVDAAANAQFIAITVNSDALQADSQQGFINGSSRAPIAGGFLTLDNSGAMYVLNRAGSAGGFVQVLAGLNASAPIPAPQTVSTAGFYLDQVLTDNNTAGAVPLENPLSVAFDSAGNRYIVDNTNNRVVVQTAGGAFIRAISTDGNGHALSDPQVVRVQGSLVYISELQGEIVIVYTNGTAYSTIIRDDQGSALSPNTLIGFDVDSSGHLIIPETTVVQTGGTVNVRIFALTDRGMAVPGSSFTVTGVVAEAFTVSDLIVDRTLSLVYVAYASGSIVSYSLASANLGTVVRTFTSWGNANPFQSLTGLALDVFNHLYIADYAQGVIVLSASTGAYVTNFQGLYGGSPDVMTYSVTVEPRTGHVFMTDGSLNRVVVVQGFTVATPVVSSTAAVAAASSSASSPTIPTALSSPTSAATPASSPSSSAAPSISSSPAATSVGVPSVTSAAAASTATPATSAISPSTSAPTTPTSPAAPVTSPATHPTSAPTTATSTPAPSSPAAATSSPVSPFPTSSSSSSSGSTRAGVVGDPQFTGFRDQSFQVHGIDGHVYSLISEPRLQVNSRFVFLSQGRCPLLHGEAGTNCWSHPGSYMSSVSVQQRADDGVYHRVLVEAGSADEGLGQVECDGVALEAESTVVGEMSVTRLSSHSLVVQTPHFVLSLFNSDGFLNQAVRPTVALSKLRPHGLLGQTWQRNKAGLEGRVEDYSQSHNNIFGADDLFNRFELPPVNTNGTTTVQGW